MENRRTKSSLFSATSESEAAPSATVENRAATISGYGDRVERLGTSRMIPRKQYWASRVVKELRQLFSNSKYAAQAAEIGQILQAENGVKMACEAIEQQLKD